MALFTPSESPAVVVKEIDLTGGVPNVQSTTGATVGNFRWGPVEQRVAVANEAELVSNFASPDTSNTIDFHSASYFLRYSSSLQVVRAVTSAAQNAYSSVKATATTGNEVITGDFNTGTTVNVSNSVYSADSAATLRAAVATTTHQNQDVVIKNLTDFESQEASLADITSTIILGSDSDGSGNLLIDSAASNAIDVGNHTFVAKYPGALGNSIEVSICPPGDAFDTWDYKTYFDGSPLTSDFAKARGCATDEIHVAVVDEDGLFTGTKGTVLETFPYLSVATNALSRDAVAHYAQDVVNNNSNYVWWVNFDSDYRAANAGGAIDATSTSTFLGTSQTVKDHSFSNGVNSGSLGTSEYTTGFDLFEDKDQVEVDFLIAPGLATDEAQKTIVADLNSTASQTRKDCVVVTSPARGDVVGVSNTATIVNNIVDQMTGTYAFPRSSYLIVDGNYLKVYDKYNDQYIQIPAASSTAGIMAATDLNRAAWFSPAGARRGQYLGITSLTYTPTKTQRDSLYKNGVNPIANIPGQGTILFGDKTALSRPSAFDRINVRRLFLILERAISRAAQNVLFEFNDEFTRAEFVNIVEPVLREIKGRRGITDFRVVADETNNTPEVIDRNEFIADIFIKPARSINYVTLNFVAVRTGVDFEEVVGTV
jgi:hypothetical protein